MKTIEELEEYFKNRTFITRSCYKIQGFLHGKGIVFEFKINYAPYPNSTYQEFINWFNTKPIPFKVGDWVRVKATNYCFKIIQIVYTNTYVLSDVNDNTYAYTLCELYKPEKDEFYVISNPIDSWIEQGEYAISIKWGYVANIEYTCDVTEIRPASEEEKQKLIAGVEEKFFKTYDASSNQWISLLKAYKETVTKQNYYLDELNKIIKKKDKEISKLCKRINSYEQVFK